MKTKIIAILLLCSLNLFAAQTVHSSASLYYEMKDFSNSKQKYDGVVYGVGADLHYKNNEFRMAYEKGQTSTVRSPRLPEDLEVHKLFTRYGYNINSKFAFHLNYINVLSDNIVPTDKSEAYGAGLSYNPLKAISLHFTQYYVDYQVFETYQSDLSLDYKGSYEKLKYKFTLIGKYIKLHNKDTNVFSKNAQNEYTTVGIKFHSHYNSYHFGFGAFFGKRAFAVMDDGFKLQHHAMEFDKTYAIGVGKSLGNFVLRYQYVYQRATELPFNNQNVDISNNRIILNYKF